MALYRVEAKGSETTIRKCRWWEGGGKAFKLAKALALREMRFHKEAFEENIAHVMELHPCETCGEVTASKYGSAKDGTKYACEKHGGKAE